MSKLLSRYLALIVLSVAALALLLPSLFKWIPTSSVSLLLGIVMFGMGLTLKPQDFKVVFTKPQAVVIAFIAQFTIMPSLAWILCFVFGLPIEIAIGVILVGCCPGGTASNVITYLAGGDVALSVGVTTLSTLAAPLVTPFLVFLLAGESVSVDVVAMILSVFQVILLPIALGYAANHWFGKFTEKCVPLLPLVSTVAITLIVGIVISANAERVMSSGMIIFVVVVLHNLLGIATGMLTGVLIGLDRPKRIAVAIEVGMQNSALASSLAAIHFAIYPLATVPGALFSVWHNFSGAIIANLFRRFEKKGEDNE